MAKKKSLFKKIFGKSKKLEVVDSTSASDGGAAIAGKLSPTLFSKDNKSAVAELATAEPNPPAHRAITACETDVAPSESTTWNVVSGHSGRLQETTKNEVKLDEDSTLALTHVSISGSIEANTSEDVPDTKNGDPPPSFPNSCELGKGDVAVDLAPDVGVESDAKATTKEHDVAADLVHDRSIEPDDAAAISQKECHANQVDEVKSGEKDEDQDTGAANEGNKAGWDSAAMCTGMDSTGDKEDEKKDKKAWAEERLSQMYSSSSKLTGKPKFQVCHELNVERRKWIEGLTSPKREPSASHIPGDVRTLGKLSDRMKAVERAFQEKGKDSSSSKDESPVNIPNRDNLAAQRKVIEDRLKVQSDQKPFWESKGTANPGTPSPGKVTAQKKAVEEMLQKQLDPKAFYDSKVKSPETLPGKKRLASQKKWVLETLEKQNDPNHFLDQKREDKKHLKGNKELANGTPQLEGNVEVVNEKAQLKGKAKENDERGKAKGDVENIQLEVDRKEGEEKVQPGRIVKD